MIILHNAFRKRESEAPTAKLGGEARIEDGFPFAFRDALAAVFDVDVYFAVGFVNGDG